MTYNFIRGHGGWNYILMIVSLLVSESVFGGSDDRPNILVILADDLGYNDLSCYDGWIETPHIDALAEGGIKMLDFHSNGAVCSPTRGAWLTGRYPAKTGIDSVVYAASGRPEHLNGLHPSETTIAEFFQSQGYATAMFGKWHTGYYKKYNPIRNGFDEFKGYVSGNIDFFSHIDQSGHFDWWHNEELVEEVGYVTHLIIEHSLAFLKARHESGEEKPFFLYLAHEAPHYPYQGPNDRAERIEGGTGNGQGQRKDKKQAYVEMVKAMDDGIGELVAFLDESGELEDTLILFFSDNGATGLGSNAPYRGFKGSLWEGGHRVPGIFYWKGKLVPNPEHTQLMAGTDLFPTLAGFTGISIPPEISARIDGLDLSDAIANPEKINNERFLYWEHGPHKALRHGSIKWISSGTDGKTALYDLSESPGELVEISENRDELLAKYQSQWETWRNLCELSRSPQPGDSIATRKPRVLIIGDSISIGYMRTLKALKGKEWDIHHNPGNGRYSLYGLQNVEEWIGDDRWDVIHFNWGLWDLCYRHPESLIQGKRDKRNGVLTTPLENYRDNLRAIAKILRRSRANLVWASTTPVPEGEAGRFKGSELIYNLEAEKVMEEFGIPVNDLHRAISPQFESLAIKPGDVHFSQKGNEILAEIVASAIEAHLP